MSSFLPLPGDDDGDIFTADPAQKGCMQVTKNAAISGYTIGGLCGAAMGVGRHIAAQRQGLPTSLVQNVGMPSFKAALSFACFLAGFNGLSCSLRQMRGGVHDVYNPALAGCGIGFLFAMPSYFIHNSPFHGKPRFVVINTLATGALGAILHTLTYTLLKPVEQYQQPKPHEQQSDAADFSASFSEQQPANQSDWAFDSGSSPGGVMLDPWADSSESH